MGDEFSEFRYDFADHLWVITPYYNPCNYERRRYNYEVFARTIRESGIPLLTVECAFGDQPFSLPESLDVVKVSSNSLLWQKERLLNLAVSWLPKSCKYVVWSDCDILFENKQWAVDTASLLDAVPLVQLFETCNRLPQDNLAAAAESDACASFASIVPNNPDTLHIGHFEKHGHTGYGWAARKDLLDEHGLYEYAIIGSADHYIAHAAFGDFEGKCMELMTAKDKTQLEHFKLWAEPFFRSVEGNVRAVPGSIYHLWHGDLEKRRYALRNRELTQYGYNPFTDILAPPGKPLEWRDFGKEELKLMFANYFASRQEDGSAETRVQ